TLGQLYSNANRPITDEPEQGDIGFGRQFSQGEPSGCVARGLPLRSLELDFDSREGTGTGILARGAGQDSLAGEQGADRDLRGDGVGAAPLPDVHPPRFTLKR